MQEKRRLTWTKHCSHKTWIHCELSKACVKMELTKYWRIWIVSSKILKFCVLFCLFLLSAKIFFCFLWCLHHFFHCFLPCSVNILHMCGQLTGQLCILWYFYLQKKLSANLFEQKDGIEELFVLSLIFSFWHLTIGYSSRVSTADILTWKGIYILKLMSTWPRGTNMWGSKKS